MIRYTVYFNGEQVKSYDIEEPVIFIGRLPENHIPIFNMGISRRHVKIELDAYGTYTLSDLNSLNGTLVNGKKVKKATLSNGDKITIGKYTIVYEDLRGEAALHLETIVAEFRPEDMQRAAQAPGLRAPQAVPPPAMIPSAPQAAPPPQAMIPSAPQAAPPPQAMMPPAPQAAPPPQAMMPPAPQAAPPPQAMIPPAPQAAPPQAMMPPAPQAAPPPPAMIPPAPQAVPPPQATMPPAPQAVPPQTDEEALSGAVLIETAGHIVYKLDRDYITIGPDADDDIYAAGFMVNKGFAAIERRDGGFYITAQKVMAKIKVNGKSARNHRLEHRDRIEIGSNTFRFMENG